MSDTCAICNTILDPARKGGPVANGICPSCFKKLIVQARKPLQDFLDRLGVPILLVDDNARVRIANRHAVDFLKKDPTSIENRYAGDAIECIYAREGGGCGKTVHCRACTIRIAVLDTYTNGRSYLRMPAYADVAVYSETKPVRFLISTEKVGELVMLRIDEAQDRSAPSGPGAETS